MKLLKGRGNTSAIWRVVSDDHTTLLGIVGEIKEMVNVGILRWSNDHGAASKRNFEGWVFIEPAGGKYYADTREGALQLGVPERWR
jgi:hypothetical protein